MEALAIVDTLLATYDSEDISQHSVACTAKPEKIDGEARTAGGAPPPIPPPLPPQLTLPPSTSSNLPSPSSLSPDLTTPPSISPDLPFSPSLSPDQTAPPPIPTPSLYPDLTSPPSISLDHTASHSTSSQLNSSEAEREPPSPAVGVAATVRVTEASEGDNQSRSHPAVPVTDRQTQKRQQKKKKKKTAVSAPSEQTQQSHQGVLQPRQQQQISKCDHCGRQGHTSDQCLRKVCDHCQGRFHSSVNCRVKIAQQRQQELVQAVRQSGQDALAALKSVAWQLQQPPIYQRQSGPPLVAPYGPPVPQSAWPFTFTAPVYAPQYGIPPQHPPATTQQWQQ